MPNWGRGRLLGEHLAHTTCATKQKDNMNLIFNMVNIWKDAVIKVTSCALIHQRVPASCLVTLSSMHTKMLSMYVVLYRYMYLEEFCWNLNTQLMHIPFVHMWTMYMGMLHFLGPRVAPCKLNKGIKGAAMYSACSYSALHGHLIPTN